MSACSGCGRESGVDSRCDQESTEQEILFRSVVGEELHRLSEVQRLVLRSALGRGDLEKATLLMVDWGHQKQAWVLKWVPGDHFYAQGRQFDRYEDAESYLRELGFQPLGLRENKVPRAEPDGD